MFHHYIQQHYAMPLMQLTVLLSQMGLPAVACLLMAEQSSLSLQPLMVTPSWEGDQQASRSDMRVPCMSPGYFGRIGWHLPHRVAHRLFAGSSGVGSSFHCTSRQASWSLWPCAILRRTLPSLFPICHSKVTGRTCPLCWTQDHFQHWWIFHHCICFTSL